MLDFKNSCKHGRCENMDCPTRYFCAQLGEQPIEDTTRGPETHPWFTIADIIKQHRKPNEPIVVSFYHAFADMDLPVLKNVQKVTIKKMSFDQLKEKGFNCESGHPWLRKNFSQREVCFLAEINIPSPHMGITNHYAARFESDMIDAEFLCVQTILQTVGDYAGITIEFSFENC